MSPWIFAIGSRFSDSPRIIRVLNTFVPPIKGPPLVTLLKLVYIEMNSSVAAGIIIIIWTKIPSRSRNSNS